MGNCSITALHKLVIKITLPPKYVLFATCMWLAIVVTSILVDIKFGCSFKDSYKRFFK